MSIRDEHYRQQIEDHEAAEREARRESRRAWGRVLGEIMLWTLLGLAGFGLAFHAIGFELGMIYWWAGCVVWVGGVSTAVLAAHRRGEERGDW